MMPPSAHLVYFEASSFLTTDNTRSQVMLALTAPIASRQAGSNLESITMMKLCPTLTPWLGGQRSLPRSTTRSMLVIAPGFDVVCIAHRELIAQLVFLHWSQGYGDRDTSSCQTSRYL